MANGKNTIHRKTGKHMNLMPFLQEFAEPISEGKIAIYNEASVQFELALFLRKALGNKYKIQLERNIDYFGLNKRKYIKKKWIS